ncbi:MAG: 50S ribosomal protein L4 [Verrucomicrobia bacterium]|nr:50S ribosomal protein L4 [Verrucomicrobiota bacterium]
MKITVKDLQGKDQGQLEISAQLERFEELGNKMIGTQAAHEVVTAIRAARRSGTACTKTMGDVAGTGKKPWRQKGTGRARSGSFASPLWVGGGVVFGPKPRDYSKKVNRKVSQLALQKILSNRVADGDLIAVEELKMQSPKTGQFVQMLKDMSLDEGKVLFLASMEDDINTNFRLASRNVPRVKIVNSATVNTFDLVAHPKIVVTRKAWENIEKRIITQ